MRPQVLSHHIGFQGTHTTGIVHPSRKSDMTPSHDSQLVLRVSEQLHRHDPMNTCCCVNEGMEDEYLGEAEDIVRRLSDGGPLRDALIQTFDRWFWEGCLLDAHRQSNVNALLASLTRFVRQDV